MKFGHVVLWVVPYRPRYAGPGFALRHRPAPWCALDSESFKDQSPASLRCPTVFVLLSQWEFNGPNNIFLYLPLGSNMRRCSPFLIPRAAQLCVKVPPPTMKATEVFISGLVIPVNESPPPQLLFPSRFLRVPSGDDLIISPGVFPNASNGLHFPKFSLSPSQRLTSRQLI